MVTLTEKRFFNCVEDDISVTLRECSGSYGGGRKYLSSAIAVDMYNHTITGDITMSLTAARMDEQHIPCVIVKS